MLPTAIAETARDLFLMPLFFEDDSSSTGSIISCSCKIDGNSDGDNEVDIDGKSEGIYDDNAIDGMFN